MNSCKFIPHSWALRIYERRLHDQHGDKSRNMDCAKTLPSDLINNGIENRIYYAPVLVKYPNIWRSDIVIHLWYSKKSFPTRL